MQTLENTKPVSVSVDGGLGMISEEAVVCSILDRSCRMIVLCSMEKAKTVEEISAETGIPLSTCYRKVAELMKERILMTDRIVMTEAGRKHALYRSVVSGIHVNVGHGKMSVSVVTDLDVANKLRLAPSSRPLDL